jgi:ubiquinone/menaquinone biosynthesis C-methylase UbiE
MRAIRAGGRPGHQALVNSHFERAASYWADVYRSSDVDAVVYQARLRRVLALVDGLGLAPGTRVLEIGSGAGHASVALAERGFIVRAVDAVATMVEATRDRVAKAGYARQVTTGLADIRSLPAPDESVSLVLALGVLPWLPACALPLQQIARVLHRGGHAIVTVDNRWGLRQLVEPYTNPLLWPAKAAFKLALRPFRRPHDRALTHSISIRAFDAELAVAGFKKIAGSTLGFGSFTVFNHSLLSPPVGLNVHRRLQALADRGLPLLATTGSQYIVLGRRE